MGYDMGWRRRPEDEAAAVKAAMDEFHAAAKARNEGSGTQAAVDAADKRWSEAERSYFRLNIWGMSTVCSLLAEAEAVHDRMSEHPPWPELADYGLTEYPDTWEAEHGHRQPLTEAEQEFLAAQTEVLSAGIEYPGIPVHKFGSNDGWIVTPIECESAANNWHENRDRVVGEEHIEIADEFVAWIADAAHFDGFEVH